MCTILTRTLYITEVPDKTLRFANRVDMYVQNQTVLSVSGYDFLRILF